MSYKNINDRQYAYAIDLGSTTIDTAILDVKSKKRIEERSFKNRQSLYGSDIINRILAASRDAGKLDIMRNMVIDDIRENASDMLLVHSLKNDDIKEVCICGNAAMISILLRHDISAMGYAPFETKLNTSISDNSKLIFEDDFFCGADLFLSGTVSAFIGGDILSGMSVIEHKIIPDKYKDKDINWLFLDLGTNGEMVLYSSGKYYAASASCGPAFEGCTRKQQIYGCNTLDAIALGLRAEKIQKNGALKPPYDEKGITISKVELNSDIIREIILAKAAIRTGIDFLLREAELSYNDIDVVFLAGGFGFYLDLDTACYVGMLPDEFYGRVNVIGNSSLEGAVNICADKHFKEYIDEYIVNNKIKVIQLADKKDYQECLIENMMF